MSTAITAFRIEPRCHLLGFVVRLHDWAMLVKQVSHLLTVELDKVVDGQIAQLAQMTPFVSSFTGVTHFKKNSHFLAHPVY